MFEQLKLNNIIVKENDAEGEGYIKKVRSYYSNNKTISVTISPSFICNFKCEYCFVSKDNRIMNNKTINNIIEFLYSKHIENEYADINIMWFGGEPLLQMDIIIQFMEKIKKRIPLDKIHGAIITNGYLLKENIIYELLKYNIKTIQVTLDGNEETHNKYRIHKSNRNTFEVIIKNLRKILSLDLDFTLNLRFNFFPNEKFEIGEVIDYLGKYINKDSRVHIQLKPIICFDEDSGSSNCSFESYGDIEKYKLSIEKRLCEENSNRKISLPKPKIKWCSAGDKNIYNIGPSGELYFCKSQYGHKEEVIGFIGDEGKANYYNRHNEYIDFCEKLIDDKCKTCFALPICMGGCKIIRLNRKNDYCYWKREHIEEMIKIWLKGRV